MNLRGAAIKGLAGAAALAGANQSYGAVLQATLPPNFIPTSGVTTPGTSTNPFAWDVNKDGINDFQFVFNQVSTSGNFLAGIYGLAGGAGKGAVVGYTGYFGYAYANRLTLGTSVGPTSPFLQNAGYYTTLASRFGTTNYGQLGTRGYVGFEFTAADGLHYGYIETIATPYASATSPGGIRFFSAAYQSTPNTAITIAAVPEPSSLAALAFGAAGVAGVGLRRRNKAAKLAA